jgi:hypothetical protein
MNFFDVILAAAFTLEGFIADLQLRNIALLINH